MNTHYIPRLLLKQFATSGKVNTYNFTISSFATKKLKNTFAEKDLFDEELEAAFAKKLEGPVGDLLNNRLLKGDVITINRRENLLMRKFLLINNLRTPFINTSWEEMVRRTGMQDHSTVQTREFLIRHIPEAKEWFDKMEYKKENYIPNLKKAMETDSLEELADSEEQTDVSERLKLAARHTIVTTVAFWDCTETGQEFILPKLPGISQLDQVSIFYKSLICKNLLDEKKKQGCDAFLEREIMRLLHGSALYSGNFSVYPLSPTRIMVCFSPYFRGFFPVMDAAAPIELHPPLLNKEQFNRHFFKPMRMELFKPCIAMFNQMYQYKVKQLTAEETQEINALLLQMETEEFVFHDFNKIRDSFWYYDHRAQFANKKKHDFHHLE